MARMSDVISAGYKQVPPVDQSVTSITAGPESLQPALSCFMRCPLPPVVGASPDSLRQYYRGGILPQRRLFSSINTIG